MNYQILVALCFVAFKNALSFLFLEIGFLYVHACSYPNMGSQC